MDLSAYAATSGDYTYEVLDDGTVEITGYTGTASSISIPGTIGGKKSQVLERVHFGRVKVLQV